MEVIAELARMRQRECSLLEQLHKLTNDNESLVSRESILAKSYNALQMQNSQLKERACLLEMLYLEQVDLVENQAKLNATHDDMHQWRTEIDSGSRRGRGNQVALGHLRRDYNALQSSYHDLAAENSMLHTKLKALTNSFRVASETMQPQVVNMGSTAVPAA